MRAMVMRGHGGPEVLQLADLPDPVAAPGWVVLRVRAVALNHLDVFVRQGWPGLALPMPHVPGSDVAGVVESVGAGVDGVSPGDEVIVNPGMGCGRCERCLSGQDNLCRHYVVLGEHRAGGYAERMAAPAANLVPRPGNLTFEEAACLPVAFLTAWHALVVRAGLRVGEALLVHAAGSGVGSAAVQIGKLLGARVIATAGSDAKCQKARALGADLAVNYEAGDFLRAVKEATGRRGVDVVFEHTGKVTFERSLAALALGGRVVTVGTTSGWDPRIDLRHVFVRQLSIIGSTMGSRGELVEVVRHVEAGRLRPVVDRVMPLAEAAAAQQLLVRREQFGKIVLVP